MSTKVKKIKNETDIEYIKIDGLFGRVNVNLPFNNVGNIYIGENGMGKTTILNCIYYLLEKKFSRLAEINFESITLKFKSEPNPHEISIYDIDKYNRRAVSHKKGKIDIELIEYILDDMIESHSNKYLNKMIFDEEIDMASRRIARILNLPFPTARRGVVEYIETNRFNIESIDDTKGDAEKVKRLILSINKYIPQELLYLPTYRRIEDDYTKLNIMAENSRDADMLIRFGMSDVLNSKEKILQKISSEAIDGFNKMAGVLLKQYANSTEKIETTDSDKNIDIDTVTLVLDRIGDEIDDNSKNEIIELIRSKRIYTDEYSFLMDLLNRLIISYDSQKKYDDRIKSFAAICNKYLNEKKFYYNPSELTLEIYMTSNGERTSKVVEFKQLSSGEKQIVSLFSKLYLENEKDAIIIIDEPELSLSIAWQRMLLPDIIRSGNCKLLLTVTHSPFIFENDLDVYAREMRRYITYVDGE